MQVSYLINFRLVSNGDRLIWCVIAAGSKAFLGVGFCTPITQLVFTFDLKSCSPKYDRALKALFFDSSHFLVWKPFQQMPVPYTLWGRELWKKCFYLSIISLCIDFWLFTLIQWHQRECINLPCLVVVESFYCFCGQTRNSLFFFLKIIDFRLIKAGLTDNHFGTSLSLSNRTLFSCFPSMPLIWQCVSGVGLGGRPAQSSVHSVEPVQILISADYIKQKENPSEKNISFFQHCLLFQKGQHFNQPRTIW